ncbi:MAG: hypothetical protein ACKVRP_08900 [Bacteroidota bacterium]
MNTMRLLVAVVLLFPLTTHAAPPISALSSRTEVKLHLLNDLHPESLPENSLAQEQLQRKKKAVGLAAIYSLLLPGMGEIYADGFSSGKYFMAAEAGLWLTFTAFEIHGNSLRDDARAFAASRAGIDASGKDDQFFVDIGNFLDIHEYNEKQLRDRENEKLYDPNAGYAWRWDSDASRAQYRGQRIDSETMYNNKKFVVAAVIINHVASAINAARSAISYNKSIDEEIGQLQIKADVLGGLAHPHGIMLTVTKGF